MPKINSINNSTGSLTIDPGASGDSYTQHDIGGVGKYRVGVDDDDGDKFKISSGSALGTNDCLVVTSDGEITKPLTSAFLAVLDSTISNVTGDGTVYKVVWDTEVFDQNSDFDGTSTFAAHVTGRYVFDCALLLSGVLTSHTSMYIRLVTSNRTYLFNQVDPGNIMSSGTEYGIAFSVLCDMDASDTAYINVNVQNGTKVIDLVTNGSSDPYNWFSGSLQC